MEATDPADPPAPAAGPPPADPLLPEEEAGHLIRLARAVRARVRALLTAAGLPEWFCPADLAALLVGAGAGSTLILLFQPLLGAWVFAEGCFYVWQSYR
jgi:hypothetical protein